MATSGLNGKKKVESIVKISDKQLKSLTEFADGYISALVTHDLVEDIEDDWCSCGEEWDVNIHALGEAGNIYAVAHPMSRNRDGYQVTEMSRMVRIGVWRKSNKGEWRMKGNKRSKKSNKKPINKKKGKTNK